MKGWLRGAIGIGHVRWEYPVAHVPGKADGHSRASRIQTAGDLLVLQARCDHALAVQQIHDRRGINAGKLVNRAAIELAPGHAHSSLQARVTSRAAASGHGEGQKPDARG
jgi:hypothetical protein